MNRRSRDGDCRVCMVPHDDEIHAATLSIRKWLRHQVTRRLDDFDNATDVAGCVA